MSTDLLEGSLVGNEGSRETLITGPNAQALAVQRRTGHPVRSLRRQYVTPNDVQVPSWARKAPGLPEHRPVFLRDALPPVHRKNVGVCDMEGTSKYRTLDGFLLLEMTGVAFPDDARKANVACKRLNEVVVEDLSFFTGLSFLDASENLLDLAPFGILPRLKDLKLACNNITTVSRISGFENLQTLDLSYNKLALSSVQALDFLPNLRELDLCGNDLRMLPIDMYRFGSLEKLLLENNKIADNNVFPILCSMPNLREVSLAYNFLSEIAWECCAEGYFRALEGMDLAYNYISDEQQVSPLCYLPRINKVILYGNPICGPTGEDALQVYVEELVNLTLTLDERAGKKPMEIVTEIPKKRKPLKKGEVLGRQTLYRNFDITYVDDTEKIDGKNSGDWRAQGTASIFGDKEKKTGTTHDTDPASYTFLTAPIQSQGNTDGDRNAERIVNNVMGKVAGSYGLTQSAEILALRDVATARRTPYTLTAEEDNSNSNSKFPRLDGVDPGCEDSVDDKVL